MDKENQDAFAVIPSFGRNSAIDELFLGVFDGHGRDGHLCARYVRDNVSIILQLLLLLFVVICDSLY